MTFWEEQMKHEATLLYFCKLQILIREYSLSFDRKELNCLEIGLDVGISARAFLEFDNIKLTSVDCGDVDIGIKEIMALTNSCNWRFHHMTSDKYFIECKKEYDIIYVDGDHSYQQVKKDADNAWKFLKAGGIMIGHDIIHKNNFRNDSDYGVAQAFAEFISEQNVEAIIYPPHPGLIVIKKI